MKDYLRREAAPLTAADWRRLDDTVAEAAGAVRVARRFLPLSRLPSPGLQAVPAPQLAGQSPPRAGLAPVEPDTLALPIIQQNFQLAPRAPGAGRQPAPDIGPAADAAAFCAVAEDNLICNGHPGLGYAGLLTAPGRLTLPLAAPEKPDSLFRDVLRAVRMLAERGRAGPCALVAGPALYGALDRTGGPGIGHVRQACPAGVYELPIISGLRGAVLSAHPDHLDLAVAQDLVTAFQHADDQGLYFSVFEILVLRIKQPDAICTLERGTGPA